MTDSRCGHDRKRRPGLFQLRSIAPEESAGVYRRASGVPIRANASLSVRSKSRRFAAENIGAPWAKRQRIRAHEIRTGRIFLPSALVRSGAKGGEGCSRLGNSCSKTDWPTGRGHHPPCALRRSLSPVAARKASDRRLDTPDAAEASRMAPLRSRGRGEAAWANSPPGDPRPAIFPNRWMRAKFANRELRFRDFLTPLAMCRTADGIQAVDCRRKHHAFRTREI